MSQPEKEKPIQSFKTTSEIEIATLAEFQFVHDFFGARTNWVCEGNACWSSRDRMVRIHPDGIGYNFEVWLVDGLPSLKYCYPLANTAADFIIQTKDAGID